jgi:hypothetical protein
VLVLDAKASLVAVLETVIAPQSVLGMTMMQICVRECNDGDIDLCAGDDDDGGEGKGLPVCVMEATTTLLTEMYRRRGRHRPTS